MWGNIAMRTASSGSEKKLTDTLTSDREELVIRWGGKENREAEGRRNHG